MKNLYFLLLLTTGAGTAFAQPNPAPSTLSATAPGYNQVVLTWKDNSTGETKFEIERNNLASFTKIGEASANATTYTDNSVGGGTYRVRAVFATGAATGYSNEFTINTPAQPPTVPTNLAAAVQGANLIRLTWTNPGAGSATDFLLERGSSSAGPFSQLAVVPYSRTPTYDDNLALSGTPYCYRVRARGPGGTSGFSNVDCKTTPMAPSNIKNLKAEATSSSSIKLTWDKYGKESGINIERRTSRTGNWSKVATTLADGGEYIDNGLNANSEYCYRVAESGHDYSAEVCATTQQNTPTRPQAPARLAAIAVSSSQINLQWADLSDNETGFVLESAPDGANWTKVQDIPANQTTFSHTGLNPSTKYYYQIRAVNAAGASANSDPANATTPASPPGAPLNMVATAVSPTQIDLTWTGPGAAGGDFYEVQRADAPGGSYQVLQNVQVDANGAGKYSDQNRTPGTRYCYKIRRYSAPQSDFGAEVCATTLPPALTAPKAPIRLTATAAAFNQINLQWADQSDNESGFELERATDGANFTKVADIGANATSSSNQGLQPRTKYFYRIRAKNAAGNSDYSNIAEATTPDAPPATPARLTATAVSPSQINLEWADVSDNETGFQLEQSLDENSWTRMADLPANTTAYQQTGLNPATRYYYRVRALNAVGVSDFSGVAGATTQDKPLVPPAAPARLTATPATPTQMDLAWADLADNESRFELERGSSATGTFTKLADLPANTTTYQDINLTDNTAYCYRVRAVNAAGASAHTDVVCATTPLAPPTAPVGLAAQVVDYDQIRLAWPAVSGKAETVVIERSLDPNAGFVQVGQQPAGQVGYVDVGLREFTTYYYRIRATNTAGNSGYSNVASARVEEVVIAVEDEWANHTTLFVNQQVLHITTSWYQPMQTTIRLLTLTGQVVLTDSRSVNPADAWHYSLDRLPTGIYILALVADGRSLTRRILLP